jgi:hypothetical protein
MRFSSAWRTVAPCGGPHDRRWMIVSGTSQHLRGGNVDIHPYTSHDIARLRCEERLLRAQEAPRAREAGRETGSEPLQPAGAMSRLLRRLARAEATATATTRAGPDAV